MTYRSFGGAPRLFGRERIYPARAAFSGRLYAVLRFCRVLLTANRRLLLAYGLLTAGPVFAGEFTLDLHVLGGNGQIVAMPGNAYCASSCSLQGSGRTAVTLFAIPDSGYRLQGWGNDCAGTIGPLCTLKVASELVVTARFVKAEATDRPSKAILLLHGDGARHTVWNDFVKQRFDDRCPVVYGGVVLGRDAQDPRNDVYCYRADFGYYDAFDRIGPAKPQTIEKHRAYEIRAAVLGILARHPNLSLTLVAEERATAVALSFLRMDNDERANVLALLGLRKTHGCEQSSCDAIGSDVLPAISIWSAEPGQEAALNAGLARLTGSWWAAK